MKKFPCSQIVGHDLHGVKIRLVRINWTQDMLAYKMGVTHSTMSNWLSGTTNIPFVARLNMEDILRTAEIETFGEPYPCPLARYLMTDLAGSAGTQQG